MFRLPNLRGRFAALIRKTAAKSAALPSVPSAALSPASSSASAAADSTSKGGKNVGVMHGVWGEDVAAEVLRRKGYKILARNVRPCAWDKRLEIDVVAYDREADALTFVEVKQHAHHSKWETRLRSVNARKKRLLKVACNTWRKQHAWEGGFRFDVIEVFGAPNQGAVEVDHIRHVNLFTPAARAVNWSI